MKRFREASDTIDFNLAQVLMLLSQQHAAAADAALAGQPAASGVDSDATGRVFECKTCNRQFPSFQALGGHRASHKKPRLVVDADGQVVPLQHNTKPAAPKPRTHECSICGVEFALGQALGGHMRRHRGAAVPSASVGISAGDDVDDQVAVSLHRPSKQEQLQEVVIDPPSAAEVSKRTFAYYGGAASARVQLSNTNNVLNAVDAFDLNALPQPEITANQHNNNNVDPLELTLRCTVALDLFPSLVH